MTAYEQIGLDAARKKGLTAAAVSALDYYGTAELCGVPIAPNGDSPHDFFYEGIRNIVVNELQLDEQDMTLKAQLAMYRAKFPAPTKVILDSTKAFRLLGDGKIPAGVTEYQWRAVAVAEPIAEVL